MEKVYRLTVKYRGFDCVTTVVDRLYKKEADAQTHADHYRESVETYWVSVSCMEVH